MAAEAYMLREDIASIAEPGGLAGQPEGAARGGNGRSQTPNRVHDPIPSNAR